MGATRVRERSMLTKVAAGVGNGRVLLWHVIDQSWSGQTAADLYTGPLLKALRRTWPQKRVFKVLEDNDPTGFKSTKGERAKAGAGIQIFAIPKRSPDLNVCDYALWKEVYRRMRRQENWFRHSKRETRVEFLNRLRRTAMRLPTAFIKKAVGDMARRCQRLYAARGWLFEEGGHSGRPAK